jgi:hypothetical protein
MFIYETMSVVLKYASCSLLANNRYENSTEGERKQRGVNMLNGFKWPRIMSSGAPLGIS